MASPSLRVTPVRNSSTRCGEPGPIASIRWPCKFDRYGAALVEADELTRQHRVLGAIEVLEAGSPLASQSIARRLVETRHHAFEVAPRIGTSPSIPTDYPVGPVRVSIPVDTGIGVSVTGRFDRHVEQATDFG